MALTKAEKSEDLKINATLYHALMNKEDSKVIDICREIPKGPLHTLTIHEDTVLHMATYHKRRQLVLSLLRLVSSCEYHTLTWQNNGGNTILHETGTNNKMVEVAEEILSKAPMLLNMTNKEGETALFYAARHGKTKIFKFLHQEVSRTVRGPDLKTFLHRDDKFTILHIAILSRNYWIAYQIATNYKDLIAEKDADDMTALQYLSINKPEFSPESFFKRMIFKLIGTEFEDKDKMIPFLRKYRKEKHACEWALKIADLLIQKDNSWEQTESWTAISGSKIQEFGRSKSTLNNKEQHANTTPETTFQKANTPLLLATTHGSTEIVKKILEKYPQAVEFVDKDGRNILHLAILHRQYKVLDIMEDMNHPGKRLRGKLDKNYNTLLHMVGQKVDMLKEDVKDPAYELKEDQHLYKRVEELTTTLDVTTRNIDLKTPQQLFFETNENLRSEAKTSMCEHAQNCSVVAVLIATVSFTTAYTIPGGTNDEGYPVLKDKPLFFIFTIADAISLSSALTSLVIYLHILISPFRFEDFESNIFVKSNIAFFLLIISSATMMISFVATLVLTVAGKENFSDISLYAVSFFPVLVFVFEYLPDYLVYFKDSRMAFRKMMEKLVGCFKNICACKPQSLHPIAGSMYLTSSPV